MHSCCLYGRQECIFCDYSTNQAKHHVSVMAKSSYFDRYARSHRPIRMLTPTDTHVHIDRCETFNNMSDRYASQIPKISKNCDFGDAMIESGITHRNH